VGVEKALVAVEKTLVDVVMGLMEVVSAVGAIYSWHPHALGLLAPSGAAYSDVAPDGAEILFLCGQLQSCRADGAGGTRFTVTSPNGAGKALTQTPKLGSTSAPGGAGCARRLTFCARS